MVSICKGLSSYHIHKNIFIYNDKVLLSTRMKIYDSRIIVNFQVLILSVTQPNITANNNEMATGEILWRPLRGGGME